MMQRSLVQISLSPFPWGQKLNSLKKCLAYVDQGIEHLPKIGKAITVERAM
jgi:hypothetical protein